MSCARRYSWAIITVVGLSTTSVNAQSPTLIQTPDQLLARASQLEQEEKWEQALQIYVRLFEADRHSPELRGHIRRCLRFVLQTRRYQDPSFREKVLTLTVHQALDLYTEVLAKINSLYLDAEAAQPGLLLEHGRLEFDRALGNARFRAEFLRDPSEAKIQSFREYLDAAWAERVVHNVRDARAVVSKIAVSANRHFRMRKPVAVVAEFICGACNALDEYSAYLTPDQHERALSGTALDLLSFGLRLGIRDGELLIATVRPGSQADQLLLQPGERIVTINGRSVEKVSAGRVARMLKRQDGRLELGVASGYLEGELADARGLELAEGSPDPERIDRTISIPADLPSVVGTSMLSETVGYSRLLTFRNSTLSELENAIITLQAQGMESLILDLRGNAGGQLSVAISVTHRFLASGVIVTTQGRIREFNKTHTANAGMGAYEFPLVVLVDQSTASAAEAFVAALKTNQRALLVGTPTFGKGTIQVILELEVPSKHLDDQTSLAGAVRLTVGRFLAPGDIPIEGTGIVPDIVEADPDRQQELALDHAEQLLTMMP